VIPGQPSERERDETDGALCRSANPPKRINGQPSERERDETDRDTRRNEAKEPPAVGKAGFAAGKAGGGTRPGLGTPRFVRR